MARVFLTLLIISLLGLLVSSLVYAFFTASHSTRGTISLAPNFEAEQKILFIQGIGSRTCPDDSEFKNRLSWMRSALKAQISDLGNDDFLYYEYTSSSPFSNDPTCSSPGGYIQIDTCWSLDDVFIRGFPGREAVPVTSGGQAERLASYLKNYLDDNQTVELSLVTHSQGGVLAAYTVKEKLPQIYQDRIKVIVTLDSPLRGINSLSAPALRRLAGCANNDPMLDSARDMLPASSVITKINDSGIPDTKLYTVDANPGVLCGLPFNRCFTFPLIDDSHSDAWWSTAHLSVGADTHSDIWDGCFLENNFKVCANPIGDNLGNEGVRLVLFIACAVAELAQDCNKFVDQTD